ncbi:TonB-dependent receptor [Emcibacter sp.]|uniref:TonB-dependent receptor n=1 Tax=Emcibacter sp. TaxID=1979954 RepID=UPI002AA91356|nr:TonB-dependent receptor [Emcibacter sp.]
MNRTPMKSKFLHSVSLAGMLVGATAVTAPHWATAQEADEGYTLEEITVTARRRSESLQSVPVAVTAFSGDSLDKIGAQDITYLSQTVPNTTLEVSRGTNTTITAFMRGVGQQDPVAGFEAGVGLYIDDVYLNRPQGAVLEIYDVERIEVLRGPQGTLYGRNTIGGAIKYVTKRLGDEPEVRVKGSVGTYMQLDGLLSASAPISDSFKLGGSFGYFSRDGFGENIYNGKEHYDKDILGTRLTAEFTPSDNLLIRVMGDYTKDTSNEKSGHRLTVGNTSGAPVLDDVFDTRAGIEGEQKVTQGGISGLIEWTVNDEVTFKSITAYREDDTTTPIDFDSLPAQDFDVPAIYTNDQFSQELQVLYEGEKLQGLVGFYYLNAHAFHSFDVVLAGLGVTTYTLGDIGTDTWAVFADFSYDLTETFSINLGGRYTSDKRDGRVLRQTYLGVNSPFFGNDDAILIAQPADFDKSRTDDKFTPKVTLKWQPNDDLNLYASYSQGFKGGSFDPRGDDRAADGFKPEILTSYEIGLKSTLAGGRATVNMAAFYSDYKDVQVPGSVAIDTDNDGTDDSFVGTVTNAGKAEIWGFEFEGTALLTENLTAVASLGYVNADYKEWIIQGLDVSGDRVFQNTPEWTGSFSLNYARDLKLFDHDGTLNLIGAMSFRSKTYQFETPIPLLDQDGYALVDASIVWTSEENGLRVGLHGKNLTDKEYKVAGYNFPTLGLEGVVSAFYGNPRTFTLTVDYRF